MEKKERIEWIDIAKGIGMILVVMGHTIQLGIVQPIYAFHMPLFFFLSGLLLQPDKLGNFASFTTKKGVQLLRPWAVILLISTIVCSLIPGWREQFTLDNILHDLYSANTNTFQNSSIWYLPCFFFALVFYFIMNKIFKHDTKSVFIFILFAVSLLLLKPLMSALCIPTGRLPFKIDSALVATVFIAPASWYRSQIFDCVKKFANIKWLTLFCLLTAITTYGNGWANMNSLDFGRFGLLYYPIAFIGIFFVCMAAEFICKKDNHLIKQILLFYGKNSLIIFGFQSLYIRLYLLFFNKLCGLEMVLYGPNPWMHQIGSFLIVTFVMSPLTVYTIQYLRRKGVKLL